MLKRRRAAPATCILTTTALLKNGTIVSDGVGPMIVTEFIGFSRAPTEPGGRYMATYAARPLTRWERFKSWVRGWFA